MSQQRIFVTCILNTIKKACPELNTDKLINVWMKERGPETNGFFIEVADFFSFMEERGETIELPLTFHILAKTTDRVLKVCLFIQHFLEKIDPQKNHPDLHQMVDDLVTNCKALNEQTDESNETSIDHLKRIIFADFENGHIVIKPMVITSEFFDDMIVNNIRYTIKRYLGIDDNGIPQTDDIWINSNFFDSLPKSFGIYMHMYLKKDDGFVLSDDKMLFSMENMNGLYRIPVVIGRVDSEHFSETVMMLKKDYQSLERV